jgi:di/tricarboxylate transporter
MKFSLKWHTPLWLACLTLMSKLILAVPGNKWLAGRCQNMVEHGVSVFWPAKFNSLFAGTGFL